MNVCCRSVSTSITRLLVVGVALTVVGCGNESNSAAPPLLASSQAVISPLGGANLWDVTTQGGLLANGPLTNLGSNHAWTPGDFDSDGRPDLFRYHASTGKAHIWSVDTNGAMNAKGLPMGYGTAQTFFAGRFSGSSGTELIQYDYITGRMFLRRYRASDGAMDNVAKVVDVGNEANLIIGDFDGDSRDDVFVYRFETGEGRVWTYDPAIFNFKATGLAFNYYPYLKWTVGAFQEVGRKQLLSVDHMRHTIRLFAFSAAEGQMKPSGVEAVHTRSEGNSVFVAADFDNDQLDEAFEFKPTTGEGLVRKIRHVDGVLDNLSPVLSYSATIGARETDFLRVRPEGSGVDALIAYQKETGIAKVLRYANGSLVVDGTATELGAQLSLTTWKDGAGMGKVFAYRGAAESGCSPESCNDGNSNTVDICAPEGCLHRYPVPTSVSIEKLTPFPSDTDAKHSVVGGINNAGVVVGTAALRTRSDLPDYYESRAFRFIPPSTFQVLEPGPFSGPALTDGTRSFTSGIPALNTDVNETGQMSLSVQLTWDGWYGIAREGAGRSWNDQMIGVGHAGSINNHGDLAATTVTPSAPFNSYQAVRWTEAGGAMSLGNLGAISRTYSVATGIADDGTVVGNAWIPSTTNTSPWYAAGHAFIALPDRQMVDLNNDVDPASGWELIQANGISPNGRFVVGLGLNTNSPQGQLIHAYRYDRETGLLKDLNESAQDGIAWAYAVNNFGDVVGAGSFNPGAGGHGFIYTDDYGLLSLQALMPAGTEWSVHEAKAINDSRVVLVHATQNNDGKQQILKLQVPKPSCAANSGLPPSLVVNADLECDLSGWSLGRWDATTGLYVKGGLHIQPTRGAYGKGNAIRVTVGPADPGVVTPAGYPAGASVKLSSFPVSRWVSIEFDARRADPNGASALQIDPGSGGERWVALSDTWGHHKLSFLYHGNPGEIYFYLSKDAAPWPRTSMTGAFDIDNVVLRELPVCGAPVVGVQQDNYDCNLPAEQLGKIDYKITYDVRSIDGDQVFAVTRPLGYTMGSVMQPIGADWKSFSTNVRFRNVTETQEGMLSFRVVARKNTQITLPTGKGRFEIRNIAFAPATCTQSPALSSVVMNEDFDCDIAYWHPYVHGHFGANPQGLQAAQSQLIELAHSQEDSSSGTGSLQVTQLPGLNNPYEFFTHTTGAATWMRADVAKDEKIRFSYDAKLPQGSDGVRWLRLGRPGGGLNDGSSVKLSQSWQHFEYEITERFGTPWYHFVLIADSSPEIAPPAVGTFLLDNVKVERVVDCATAGSDGMACDDGNTCTSSDRCKAGVCGGQAKSCDDGDPCTTDSCNAVAGCVSSGQVTGCNVTACLATPGVDKALCGLEPRVSCVVGLQDGGSRVVFGYKNASTPRLNVAIPVGANDAATFKVNVLSSGASSADQPAWLQAGDHPVAFSLDLPAGSVPVSWSLGSRTATADLSPDAKCSLVQSADGEAISFEGKTYLLKPDQIQIVGNAQVLTTGPLGPMPGHGEVGTDGTYSYEIPIWVPPGTNGVQPSLSLSYSSRGGNGITGVGWSLKGFSQITRCPKTRRSAGEVNPVTYLGQDQFCLDGNPLVQLADGTYRTEIETFSKIEEIGSGTSLSWKVSTKDGRILTFGHDNVRRRYLSPNKAGSLSSEFIPAWWLTSSRDRFGNEVVYEYSNESGLSSEKEWTLERYPTRILYTGPQFSREVKFNHSARPAHDALENYVSGVKYLTTTLLTGIELNVKNENGRWSTVKEYRLKYAENATNPEADWSDTSGRKSITGRALLESVRECEDHTSAAKCGPPTTFDWEPGSWDFERKQLDSLPENHALLALADVDEDGRPDLILGEQTDRDLCPSVDGDPPLSTVGLDGIRFGCRKQRPDFSYREAEACERKGPQNLNISGTQLCDYYDRCSYRHPSDSGPCRDTNSTELVASDAKWVKYSYRRNKSTLNGGTLSVAMEGTTPLVDRYFRTGAAASTLLPAPIITNLDAEGGPEVLVVEQEPRLEAAYLLAHDGPHINEYRTNLESWPVGAATPSAMKLIGFVDKLTEDFWFPPSSVAVGDYNGDGLPDVLFPSGYRYQSPGDPSGLYWSITLGGAPDNKQQIRAIAGWREELEEATLLDVNGDGKVELVTWLEDGQPTSPPFGLTTSLNKSPTFVDFNGDGLLDALDRGRPATEISPEARTVRINTGLRAVAAYVYGSDHPTSYLSPKPSVLDEGVRTGDFDMDGRTDIVLFGGSWNKTANTWSPTILLGKGRETRTVNLAARAVKDGGIARAQFSKESGEKGYAGWRQAHVTDFDGDGLLDIVQVDEDGTVALYRRKGSRPDLLKSVHRGDSPYPAAEVTYKAITDTSGGFTAAKCEGNTTAPCNVKQQQLANTGLWVVSRLTTDSGEDDGRSTNTKRKHAYNYADARTDRASGTWLGFRIFKDVDLATGESRELEFYNGSANTNDAAPWADPKFGFTLAGKVKQETLRVPGPSGTNVTRKKFEYEFVTFHGGETGLVRTKKVRTEVEDPRQTSCPGVSNVSETIADYVLSGPGALTGELLSETTTKTPGSSCQASNLRRHATQTAIDSFTYHPEDQVNWIVARVKDVEKTVTVQSTGPEGTDTSSITTKSTILIDPFTGLIKKSITEPDRISERSEIEYEYAAGTGLPVKVTTRAPGVADRFVVTAYDSYGFVRSTRNQLGHKTESVAHPATGEAIWSRDMNGVISRRYIDGFFRDVRTETPSSTNGAYLVVTNSYQAGPWLERPRQVVTTSFVKQANGTELPISWSMSILDRFGRQVWTKSRNAKGQILESEKVLDWRGWVRSESVPSAELGSLGSVTYDYDEMGRPISVMAPDGATTTTERKELRVTVRDPDGKTQESITDSLERVWKTQAIDPSGNGVGSMTFTHDAAGRLTTSTDSAGNKTIISYDVLGRRLTLQDPDAGLITTSYNGLGEVISKTTAAGATTTFVRDAVGRTLNEIVAETADGTTGRLARTRTTTFTFDRAPHGIGKPESSVSYDGVVKAFGYDELGRQITESTVKSNQEFSIHRSFDEAGRLDVVTYPDVKGPSQEDGADIRTRVRYSYNAFNSALTRVSDADTDAEYWRVVDRDQQGHVTQELFGNGIVTDRTWNLQRQWMTGIKTTVARPVGTQILQNATYEYSQAGQLRSRFDAQAAGGALTETFHYDALNRLNLWCINDANPQSIDCAAARFGVRYGFSDNGNLEERKTFENGNVGAPLEAISFLYPAAGGARPHAVTNRVWSTGQGAQADFEYDAGGRQWQRPGQEVSYNHYDLPETIAGGNATTRYLYAADGSRFEKRTVLGPNLTRTTTYVGGIYELRQETGTAATEPKTHVFYISLGNTMLAQLTRKEPDPSAMEVQYFHNDQLGTVSFTTNKAGIESTIVRSDPYGNRFDPTRAPRLDQPPPPAIAGVTRGFTGHEMEVDDLGVINMGGRIFDPVNGRFNSPDPIVHSASFGQSYNRYMYVLGNPTGYTDPTGYDAVADAEKAYNLRRLGADGRGGGESFSSALDDQLERDLEALNEMMSESMDAAQNADEEQEQIKASAVETIKATGVSEGAAKAIVNAHAQRVAEHSASGSFMVSGTQKQQAAAPVGARSATTNSGLLADNGASNGQTATDAPRYGEAGSPQEGMPKGGVHFVGGRSPEELALAKTIYDNARSRRNADGSLPDSVKAIMILETSGKEVRIEVGSTTACHGGAPTCSGPMDLSAASDPSRGSGTVIPFNPTGNGRNGLNMEENLVHELIHATFNAYGRRQETWEQREVETQAITNQHMRSLGHRPLKTYGTLPIPPGR